MVTEEEKLSLTNIGRGAVIDKFDQAFDEVLKDISDPDKSEKARIITIKAKIVPDEARIMIGIEVGCEILKPAKKPFITAALIGLDEHGKMYAQEIARHNQQQSLPLGSKVVDIKSK